MKHFLLGQVVQCLCLLNYSTELMFVILMTSFYAEEVENDSWLMRHSRFDRGDVHVLADPLLSVW